MDLKIDELNISDVSHYKISTYNGFALKFIIDDFRYNLFVKEMEDGVVRPVKVVHGDVNSHCKYCKKESYICHKLMNYQQELFHRLIEFPSIRLEWLYMNHV